MATCAEYLPFLMALGIGLTITNTKAVIEALIGKQSAFARTPKYRVVSKQDKIRSTKYRKRLGWVPWVELLIGAYFRFHHLLRRRKRELHYRSISALVCAGILVHGLDVAAPRPVRNFIPASHYAHQAIPSGRLNFM